uniref:Salivary D7 secreted protein n=1 Tax=Simulium vittatum TaxID=7192 RepID=B5M0V5_SIMVI|nr:salivary D7 secreted protein [Simulium vittatum]
MNNILVVLLIGVLNGSCWADKDGAKNAAEALVNCIQQNPGGVSRNFSLVENPSQDGKCYAKCLLQSIKVIRVVNSEVDSVHWIWFQSLIEDPKAKSGLIDCKQFIVEDLDDFCASVLSVYKCMNSRYPGTFRDAHLKYFGTDKDKFKDALKPLVVGKRLPFYESIQG